ncbi:PaaI family thioesterase [Methylibium sp.]|uniref:PaaI family thioesterase n=1 Tax=Methylibium sp. TaxID=2067992 RepID=UPI00286BF904|nr:PaaI family thioesterase [Methylibium sp.]
MQSQPMQAADPDFAARVAASFARQGAMQLIGARLQSVEAGRVVIGLAHRSELAQQHGFVHAGILATALDSACGYAASSLMPADAGALTIEFKVNLLAPAKGPRFRLEGQVVKLGRTITVVEGRALQIDPTGAERLVATMTTTVMTVTGRDGIQH